MADRHADGRIDVVDNILVDNISWLTISVLSVVVCCCLRLTFLVTLAWTLSMVLFLCLLAGRAVILPRSGNK